MELLRGVRSLERRTWARVLRAWIMARGDVEEVMARSDVEEVMARGDAEEVMARGDVEEVANERVGDLCGVLDVCLLGQQRSNRCQLFHCLTVSVVFYSR